MTVTLTWSRQNDIEILLIGEIEVGRVMATGGKKNSPRYIFNLLGSRAFWRDAKSIEEARLALMGALSDWLRRAGLQ